jgi:hypothetical protein
VSIAALHLLNSEFVRACGESDLVWYGEHLGADFVCTLADGERVSRDEFLRRTELEPRAERIGCDDVDVRLLGDVALVHGVMYRLSTGAVALTRYTTVWQSRRARWHVVAAQFTKLAPTRNPDVARPSRVRRLAARLVPGDHDAFGRVHAADELQRRARPAVGEEPPS